MRLQAEAPISCNRNLQKVRPGDGAPVKLFSQSVANWDVSSNKLPSSFAEVPEEMELQ